ncbi:MAG: hypothetical protein CVV53_04315 [Spirochaetae bacterium HGW-Spirochaetae-9]|nr:MAG: hypothetical protein CVV53_04315 [Spirochaetae bacterium HGW-Spirochaetae-9]
MDTIEITSAVVDKVRLDFPTERQIVALASAWDDDSNHQVSFLRSADFRAAGKLGEYASMIASADLALPASAMLLKYVTAKKSSCRRAFAVGERRREYLSNVEALEESTMPITPYMPLKVLAFFLSALEQRRGSVFLVGGSLAILQKAELHIRSTFPELRVVGRARGDYRESDETDIMKALQKSTPDMIVVGSMVKDAELWIPRHMRYTKSGIFLYDGSIMEILAGKR